MPTDGDGRSPVLGVSTMRRLVPPRVRGGAWRVVAALWLATACASGAARSTEAPSAHVAGQSTYDPAHDLGGLFHDVQTARVFPDSKTFVDAVARSAPADIQATYERERKRAGFSLKDFVGEHFDPPRPLADVGADTASSVESHVRLLWNALTRPADTPNPHSSLVPLPNAYVVPGGRFREIYYWDSYFTMLGLVEGGRIDLVKNMLDNFAYLVERVGHIPNGNRTYYLSRSQPPYFGAMIGLYAQATDTTHALRYLDALEREYAFWMMGADRLGTVEATRRVVRLGDGSVLNRYWDDLPEPRPESYREDYALAQTVPEGNRRDLYRNIRASAESGWDFSSRWMRDPADLRTLETTSLVPIDLNALLYHTERTIAALRAFRNGPGDQDVAKQFDRAAEARRRSLIDHAWDAADGFFYDVRWKTGERVRDRPTMAAAALLYFGLATQEQGRAVAAKLERDFLRPGGFTTTTIRSGQQWDAPNGWPPLQWLGIQGVRRYGRPDVADRARDRWLAVNRRTYLLSRKMTEKYDVADLNRPAGGGEYPTQDGFGWTNGVAAALSALASARVIPVP